MLNAAKLLSEKFLKDGATKELIRELADVTVSTIKVYDVISQTHHKFK